MSMDKSGSYMRIIQCAAVVSILICSLSPAARPCYCSAMPEPIVEISHLSYA